MPRPVRRGSSTLKGREKPPRHRDIGMARFVLYLPLQPGRQPHLSCLRGDAMQTAAYNPTHPTSTRPLAPGIVTARAPRSRAAAARAILDTALLAEHVATAFYYTALKT